MPGTLVSRIAVSAALAGACLWPMAMPASASAAVVSPCAAGILDIGEACVFAGAGETGAEFDFAVPLLGEIGLPGPAPCVDLPAGEGDAGSIENFSLDSLAVMPESCAGSVPGVAPVAAVPAETVENLPAGSADLRLAEDGQRSIRSCSAGLVFDPETLTCDFAGLVG